MRHMRAKEIRDLTMEELNKKLNDAKDELFKLRFQLATGQLDNPMRIKEVRRSIARIRTVMKELELGISRA